MTDLPANVAKKSESKNIWFNRNFLNLWSGQTISELGSQITLLALPLTAVLSLHVSPEQMGFLRAFSTVPAILVSLIVGVWVDRVRRWPLLLWTDVARMLLLALVPLLAWLQILRIEYLYLISFSVGVLTVLFDIASTSFITSVVASEQLVDGNSKMQFSTSFASVIGPGLAGLLIQIMTAPLTIIFDAFSYLCSALSIALIRVHETHQISSQKSQHIGKEIAEGLHTLWNNPLLRHMTISSAFGSLAIAIQQTVFILYIINGLHLSPVFVGAIYTIMGMASITGAYIAPYVSRSLGPGPTIVVGTLFVCIGSFFLTIGQLPQILIIVCLSIGLVLFGAGSPLYNISQLSLRQTLTPPSLLGRVNASRRFIVFGVMPIGSLIGGQLGEFLGLRWTLFVAALFFLLSFLWIFLSPLRRVREIPS